MDEGYVDTLADGTEEASGPGSAPVSVAGGSGRITYIITAKWRDGKRLHIMGTIAFSGDHPAGDGKFRLHFKNAGVGTNDPPKFFAANGKYANLIGYDYTVGSEGVSVYNGSALGAFTPITSSAVSAGLLAVKFNFHAII